jgi:hypothetical protein
MDKDPMVQFLVQRLQHRDQINAIDEASTKQGWILPLLQMAGWDLWNTEEVTPEFAVGGKRVDYALRLNGTVKVFVEIKRPSEDLNAHQEQLLNYAFQQGVRMAILTNGHLWWWYLPLHEGSWAQRRFFTIDVWEKTPAEIAQHFESFLDRRHVETGAAYTHAEHVYQGNQRVQIIEQTLPKTWRKLLDEPDDLLVDLVAEAVERACGLRPDNEQIAAFLVGMIADRSELPMGHVIGREPVPSGASDRPAKAAESPHVTYSALEEIVWKGHHIPVHSWVDGLETVLQHIRVEHPREMDRCLLLRGKAVPWFSKSATELRRSRKLEGTDLFYEINFSASYMVKQIGRLLDLFEYPHDTVTYVFRDNYRSTRRGANH